MLALSIAAVLTVPDLKYLVVPIAEILGIHLGGECGLLDLFEQISNLTVSSPQTAAVPSSRVHQCLSRAAHLPLQAVRAIASGYRREPWYIDGQHGELWERTSSVEW